MYQYMRRLVEAPIWRASTSRKRIINTVTLVALISLTALPAYAFAYQRHSNEYAGRRSAARYTKTHYVKTNYVQTQHAKAASSGKKSTGTTQSTSITTGTTQSTSVTTGTTQSTSAPTGTTTASPTPTPTPTPASTTPATTTVTTAPASTTAQTSQLCMNYGHQPTQNGSYNWSQVDAHFAVMKKAGIDCLRLAYYGFDNPDLRDLALRAKAAGMYVIVGGTWGTIDPSQLAAYDAKAIGQAKWAQANGIPQLGIGNEQEYRLSGMTQAQWQQHVVELAAKIRPIYSGKISYELSSDHLQTWVAGGMGSLDLLGFNAYCGLSCNESRLVSAIQAFGASHVYISETNVDMNTGKYGTDQLHADALKKDLLVLMQKFPNIRFYYFAFISGGSAPSHWGLYNDSGTALAQPLTAAVLGIK